MQGTLIPKADAQSPNRVLDWSKQDPLDVLYLYNSFGSTDFQDLTTSLWTIL